MKSERQDEQGPRRPPDDSEQAQLERLVTALEEVIERGEIDRIWQMIFHLRSGVAF